MHFREQPALLQAWHKSQYIKGALLVSNVIWDSIIDPIPSDNVSYVQAAIVEEIHINITHTFSRFWRDPPPQCSVTKMDVLVQDFLPNSISPLWKLSRWLLHHNVEAWELTGFFFCCTVAAGITKNYLSVFLTEITFLEPMCSALYSIIYSSSWGGA